jgi:hypothetical protein
MPSSQPTHAASRAAKEKGRATADATLCYH